MNKASRGFTLIELVVVIVILGILAVVAAPRFLNLQSDARASSLAGLKGAMESASALVYGKAVVLGLENVHVNDEDAAPIDGITVDYGYPVASELGIGMAVDGLSGDNSDWVQLGSHTEAIDNEVIVYSFSDYIDEVNETCIVLYKSNQSGGSPTIIAADESQC